MTNRGFNLSDWALHHRSLVWFLLIVSMVAGTLGYLRLGREEDPNFTIKIMVISASLPGATIEDTLQQVTTRIETKLEELDELKFTRSVTMPGQSVVYLELDPTIRGPQVPEVWKRVRNMMSDIRPEFPQEFQGFQFNDDFGDVFGNIYAFTSDGFTQRELRDRVEDIRKQVQALPMAGKTLLLGVRKERIFLEFSSARLAAMGLNHNQVVQTLALQNAISPSGIVQAGPEQVLVRVGGQFDDAAAIAAVNLRVGDRFFNIGDVATVTRGYEDPPSALFRYNGKEAIGLQIGMREGGNILEFGQEVDALMAEVARGLPIGIEMAKFADQPHVVDEAVGHFVQALAEAVAIVLLVSFVSLGLRAGFVVTLTIPLVLAITFIVMDIYGITLQRISLGALIIALGLLVDDAMIAIETMISRLEVGDSLERAASHAWSSIAFPMLTGTLVTVAGFIPIGLNSSAAGEFTFSLFVVIAVSLIVSWIVAVLFAPLLGVTLLPATMAHKSERPTWLRRQFHGLLLWGMRHQWLTIAITLAVFAVSVVGMRFVEQQFFPTSDRTEIIVDVTERANASIAKTDADMARIEAMLAEEPDALFWTTYVGRGAPRFILSMDVPTPGPYMGQIVIQTPDLAARDRLKARLVEFAGRELIGTDIYVKNLEIGPPVGKPVQYRVSSPDPEQARDAARELAAVLATEPRLRDIALDWNEPARVVRLEVNQDQARRLGLTNEDISGALSGTFSGRTITQLRDGIFLIDVVARGSQADRESLASIQNLQLATPTGMPIPLASLAKLEYDTEQPLIMQRDGLPTVTVKAAIASKDQPATLVEALAERVARFQAGLPPGVKVVVGGTVETSAESQEPIAAVVPIMLLIMATLVMVQMQGFRLSLIVFAAAPLGLIGVVAALLPFGVPMGFVAILGILALIGILIRNSVILVHEIQELIARGHARWDAVFEASDSRARPILLTAAAASLALIPISRQVFWGPMAFAMMGGIIAGTLVTLIFVPALYCAVFRVRPPQGDPMPDPEDRARAAAQE
ncbi:efflux RND transporter permease subunit [Paracoccus sp. P2]|uniref:Efflux RND transporter permease subunit n=1 Tax=Paracoccus pantotrophus TaxID=82367 RepID=A0A7H9BZ54_PARPN|nr:efflux RND transporter permease subunit [Paracoccus pantotrophus]MDF3852727.1 efflux RND transporter permease subunit [Paracoccus pantotrophus]QLH16339.1 efflux RND transporter permease subunit [Paracoccus pantotrophus]RDD97188.1 AcrB/AcrD/AcrF family protein [Paracoccus pantotrophus]RNI18455.1 efflux RND transporter permease subunit [Paracoccus pantotrophus]WGR64370.1 efflux RND transporter permease subunit [Paracoccus pantotrophus]